MASMLYLPPVSLVWPSSIKFGLVDGDEVVLNFGRMAEEKNLGLLIGMMPHLLKSRPRAKLMLAGDYVYRAQLEKMAAKSSVADKIIFTGRYDRSELPVICAAASVFAFPSLTDTQALVLNEAAGQGLPIVMCDHDLNDVFREGKNGLVAANDPQDFAAMVTEILSDTAMQQRFARASRRQAAEFSEAAQTEKLVDFYRELLHATNVI